MFNAMLIKDGTHKAVIPMTVSFHIGEPSISVKDPLISLPVKVEMPNKYLSQ